MFDGEERSGKLTSGRLLKSQKRINVSPQRLKVRNVRGAESKFEAILYTGEKEKAVAQDFGCDVLEM